MITVTGASGNIGSRIVNRLRGLNHEEMKANSLALASPAGEKPIPIVGELIPS